MALSLFEVKLKSLDIFPILGQSFSNKDFIPLDLSVNNKNLDSVNVSSSKDLGFFIFNHIKINKAKVACGGYLEKRNIYNRSHHFNKQNKESERNIHLGLDLWIDAGTQIFAPLDGKIHSFRNNTNYGDYGPTLILEHQIEEFKFYTLYGHLSLESLQDKSLNKLVKKGEEVAKLGNSQINGDYPPHLHLQVIIDLQDFKGDYPGVSSLLDIDFYSLNCPNPSVLIKYLNN